MPNDTTWPRNYEFLREQFEENGLKLPANLTNQGQFSEWLKGNLPPEIEPESAPRLPPELVKLLEDRGLHRTNDWWKRFPLEEQDDTPHPNIHLQGLIAPETVQASAALYEQAFLFTPGSFVDFSATQASLDSLHRLQNDQPDQPLYARYGETTGLLNTLAGTQLSAAVAATDGNGMQQIAGRFAVAHQALLFGSEDGQWQIQQPSANVVHLAQFDPQLGVPVYGAVATFSFNDQGRLTFLQNSCFPLRNGADHQAGYKLKWPQARDIALNHVRTLLGPKNSDPDLEDGAGYSSQEGKIVVPLAGSRGDDPLGMAQFGEAARGEYRRAWSVMVYSPGQHASWEVLVDDENESILNPHTCRLVLDAQLTLGVYQDNTQAVNGKTVLKNVIQNNPAPDPPVPTVAAAIDSTEPVEVPGGPSLSTAIDFPMDGVLFSQPDALNLTLNGLRSGNVYYHLCRARDEFEAIIHAAWPAEQIAPFALPGKQSTVPVFMVAGEGGASYVPKLSVPGNPNGEFVFTKGQTNFDIDDPALDCEVVYHEYTHALIHQARGLIVESGGIGDQSFFRQALNEGLAFYFGCALSDRLTHQPNPERWGEYAYGAPRWKDPEFRYLLHSDPTKQRPGFDHLQIYNLKPIFLGTSNQLDVDAEHAAGMLFARALWDIRRVLKGKIADPLILRAMTMIGGLPKDLEGPAEAIIHRDREAPGPSHEGALRLIFASRGIVADAPIHDLLAVQTDGIDCLFVATQRGADGSGCYFRKEGQTQWRSLGTGGPQEVVALSKVRVESGAGSPPATLLFAAGARWSLVPNASPISDNRIYFYRLDANSLDAPQPWTELPSQPPADRSILTLEALPVPGAPDEFLLFAGTETGLYTYRGRRQGSNIATMVNWQEVPLLINQRVFDLAARQVPDRRLFVAASQGIRVFDPDSLERDARFDQGAPRSNVLAVAMDRQGQGHVWVGTAMNGVFHWDPDAVAPKWQHVDGMDLPVFSLWPEFVGLGNGTSIWDLYAGSGLGLSAKEGAGAWQEVAPQNLPGSAESLAHTTVTGLHKTAARTVAVTAQRGIWELLQGQGWQRAISGLPRLGELVDFVLPAGTCPVLQTMASIDPLQPDRCATYTLYVPDQSTCTGLRLVRTLGDIDLELFYASPHVDLPSGLWAGLQDRKLQPAAGNADTMAEPLRAGYYLVVIRPRSGATGYSVNAVFE